MPNGSGLTTEQYRILDAFVATMDEAIQRFAQSIQAKVDVGYHDVPDRKLLLPQLESGVGQMIDIAPRFVGDNNQSPACLVSACAWKDYPPMVNCPVDYSWMRRRHRKCWHREIARLSAPPKSFDDTWRVLQAAHESLQTVSENDLVDIG